MEYLKIEDENNNILTVKDRLKNGPLEIQIDNYEDYDYGCIEVSRDQAYKLIEILKTKFPE